MTVNRTTLLDLPLPVTGTESGTWGDTTNNGLTQYMDIAIAGMSNLTSSNFTAGALTIETTEGTSAGTNITATSAQYAGFRVTSLAANSTITVGNTGTSPARSYRLINADSTYNLTFKATGQTGVTLLPGQSAVVAFNGTDYVIVGTVGAGTATDNAIARFDGTTGEILQNSAATIDDTGAATFVGSVNVSGTSASGADLKLYEDTDNGTNYVAFKSPASVASNVTWTLPSADGTNGQALTTNGSGTLAFSTISTSAATPTTLGTVYGSMTTGGALPYLTALGYNAAPSASGAHNTAVGWSSAYSITSGDRNVAVGNYALNNLQTGVHNTAIGFAALYTNTGSSNTAVGKDTLYLNTSGAANVGIGVSALYSNTTGANNTAVGYQAGYSNTTAGGNTIMGYQALYSNTTGQSHTAIGYSALSGNTGDRNTAVGSFSFGFGNGAANYNTGVGYRSGFSTTTGSGNVAIGDSALYANTAGANNTAVGNQALLDNTASNNTAMGYRALYSNTTGAEHVAVGYRALTTTQTSGGLTAVGFDALKDNTTGTANTAVGGFAMTSNTTGVDNSAFGSQALRTNSTGSYNIAIGRQALYTNSTASYNVAIGYNALNANSTGASNTAVGYAALDACTTGSSNVAVGKDAGGAVTGGQDNTLIGTNAGASGTNDITTGQQNTIIGYYAAAASGTANYQIVIGADCAGQTGTGYVTIGDYAGKIYANYRSSATWTQTSDASMKNVIGPDTLGLSFINRLNPIKFTWKDVNKLPLDHPRYDVRGGLDTTQVIHGFVAQEVKAALDAEGCTTFNGWDQGPDGIQAISREMFISPLVKAVQELSAQVQALQAEIATLKGN